MWLFETYNPVVLFIEVTWFTKVKKQGLQSRANYLLVAHKIKKDMYQIFKTEKINLNPYQME
jgi:hypothetical protein